MKTCNLSDLLLRLPPSLCDCRTPVLIGPGAFARLDEMISMLGWTGKGVMVCEDQMIWTQKDRPHVFRTIPFDPEQLYVNPRSRFYLRMQLAGEASWLIAAGGEAVQGLTKLAAREFHIPYIAAPTCAYGSSFAASCTDLDDAGGYRRAVGAAPSAIVADTLLAASSGIPFGALRELIDRAAALARSRAFALASGYVWNQQSAEDQQYAIDRALRCCSNGLREGDPSAFNALYSALVICGLSGEVNKNAPRALARLKDAPVPAGRKGECHENAGN